MLQAIYMKTQRIQLPMKPNKSRVSTIFFITLCNKKAVANCPTRLCNGLNATAEILVNFY